MSKLARRNKGVELSGADPYASLVLPLTKGLKNFLERQRPPETAVYFDATLALAVAVVDGPMVAARVRPDTVDYEFVPWVRLYRHDINESAAHRHERDQLYAIDVVHRDWLDSYVDEHVRPFATKYSELS
jgi:hypothetical protein